MFVLWEVSWFTGRCPLQTMDLRLWFADDEAIKVEP